MSKSIKRNYPIYYCEECGYECNSKKEKCPICNYLLKEDYFNYENKIK